MVPDRVIIANRAITIELIDHLLALITSNLFLQEEVVERTLCSITSQGVCRELQFLPVKVQVSQRERSMKACSVFVFQNDGSAG